jgi:hypothetical protein
MVQGYTITDWQLTRNLPLVHYRAFLMAFVDEDRERVPCAFPEKDR